MSNNTVAIFPLRGPFIVRIFRDDDGRWLVCCQDQCWDFGSWREAANEAQAIADAMGYRVQVRLP
jgi:hypothetical protein